MRALLIALTLAGAVTAPALAHHGWGNYDSSTLVTLEGPIQSVSYSNPHVTIVLAGDEQVWEVILAPPSRMARRGIAEGELQVDLVVTVEGYASKVEDYELRAERITINGKTVELR